MADRPLPARRPAPAASPAKSGPATTTALARLDERLLAPITAFADFAGRLEALRSSGTVNLLTPLARIDYMLPLHQISLRVVQLDPSVDRKGNGPECYADRRFCEQDEVAMGKIALLRLMNAAGVQEVAVERLDDRSDPRYCEIATTLGMRTFDGQWLQRRKSKAVDLRRGAPDTFKPEWVCGAHQQADCSACRSGGQWSKTGRQVPLADTALAEKVKHIVSTCETLSAQRTLRTLLELKQKYKIDEVRRPFVIPVLVPNLDPDDPEQKAALLRVALGAEGRLFGAPPPAPGGHAGGALQIAGSPDDRSGEPVAGGPVIDVAPAAEPEPVNRPEDIFAEEAPADEPQPAPLVCACPCGHQVEIDGEVYAATVEACGSSRCRLCYPGRWFDFESHKHLRVLGLAKFPELTPAEARGGVPRG